MATEYNNINKEVIEAETKVITEETISEEDLNEGMKPTKEQPQEKGNLIKRFFSGLLGTKDIKNVGKTIWKRVVVPNMEDILIESLHSGIDMYFRNKMPDKHYSTGYSGRLGEKYHYAGQYQGSKRSGVKVKGNGAVSIEPCRFISKSKAVKFLAQFEDDISEDGFAKVSKYLAKTRQKLPDFTITNLGWYDLDDAKIIHDPDPEPDSDGNHYDWLLIMPEPEKIR